VFFEGVGDGGAVAEEPEVWGWWLPREVGVGSREVAAVEEGVVTGPRVFAIMATVAVVASIAVVVEMIGLLLLLL